MKEIDKELFKMNIIFFQKYPYKFLIVSIIFIIIGLITRKRIITIIFTVIFLLALVYIVYEKNRKKYVQPALRNLLTRVTQKFNEHDIKYWVDYGSLLGIIREKDIIAHDTDTDICLFPQENIGEKLIQIVKEMGHPYYLEYNPWSIDTFRIYKREFRFLPNPYTDIYTTKLQENKYVDVSGKIPVELVGTPQKIVWNNVEIFVPEKIHETLVWRYGENYLTPIIGKTNER